MTTPAPTSGLGWLRWAIPLAGVLLWFAGFPAPHSDDLFFGGAAIHLAQGHGLGNPWVGNWLQQHFHSDAFYVQPPYHTWAQGAWLWLVGISGATLRAFPLAWSTVGAVAVADALIRGGVPRRIAGLATIVWFGFILYYGLRADALGLGLIGAGHLLLVRPSTLSRVVGLWLCGLGAATHPFALTVAIPVLAAHLGVAAWQSPTATDRRRLLLGAGAAAAAGAILIAVLGVALIGGEVGEFFRIFNHHRNLALPGALQRWDYFSGQFLLGRESLRRLPFVIGAIGLIGFGAWRGPAAVRVRWCCLGLAFMSGLGYTLYAQYLARYLVFALFLLLPLAGNALAASGWPRGAALILALLTCGTATDFLALAARRIPPPAADVEKLRAKIATDKHPILVLDEFSIRYLYDFRPPARTRDWQVGRPAGGRLLGFPVAQKPAEELWVVNTYKLARAVSGLSLVPSYLQFGGHSFRSLELGVDLAAVP